MTRTNKRKLRNKSDENSIDLDNTSSKAYKSSSLLRNSIDKDENEKKKYSKTFEKHSTYKSCFDVSKKK